jgi:uncharacterized protein YqfB (UPF0267 family)
MIIDLKFCEKGVYDILAGRKTCTTRGSPKGLPGDRFKLTDTRFTCKDGMAEMERVYELVAVHPVELADVASNFYKQEGYDRPADFWQDWKAMHHGEDWYHTSIVYIHWFRRVQA